MNPTVAEDRSEKPRVATSSEQTGEHVGMVVFSHYPSDPRPRRAAEALVQSGMNVEVICLKQNPQEPAHEVFNGVRIRRLTLKRRRGGKISYLWQYGYFLAAAFCLLGWRSLWRRYRLVHVHNMPDVLVFSALIPKLRGAKVILDQHDPMPELMMTIYGLAADSAAVRVLKSLEKASLGFADAVLAVNIACKRIFSERSCSGDKVRVVMNAPDEGIFKNREQAEEAPVGREPGGRFVMMYHGSLVERHGLDLAVQALARIKPLIPGAELRVYGQSTPYLEEVMQQVCAAGLQDSVRWLGGKKLEEIATAIGECDLGIIPNRRSIFTELNTPTRIFEYLSQGKPVIAPAAAGIQDYFGPDELIYFELGNGEDLANKMQYVFSNPAEVQAIVQRGREVYLDHRWSKERQRFLELVEGLLRPTDKPGLAAVGARLARSGDYE